MQGSSLQNLQRFAEVCIALPFMHGFALLDARLLVAPILLAAFRTGH